MYKIGDTWVLHPSPSVVDILEQGLEYHAGMVDLAASLCSGRRTFVDVGACYGLITKQMASVAERVMAFEPNREIFACLQKNTEDLPNVELSNCGLSNEQAQRRLLLYGNDGRSTYRDVPVLTLLQHRKTFRLQDTKTITLDSLNLEDVDLIKMDVEGYEKEVVQGSLRTIARCEPVIIAEQKAVVVGSKYIPAALELLGYELHAVFRGKDYIYAHRQGGH
tara:strand:- start:3240 stop:3902 length:663 start_codon:yes stop_codon:yes gene_type:complete